MKCANRDCDSVDFVKQVYILGHGFICLKCWERDIDNPSRIKA